MQFEPEKYYHFYNRSNNREIVFKNQQCYELFLHKYSELMHEYVHTYAYCLMPTHFHFLIQVCGVVPINIQRKIVILLSSYTKTINLSFHRHGSLFQPRSKAIEINDENYLLTLISYIHQNPIRAKLVKNIDDWEHSSYRELAGLRKEFLVSSSLINRYFRSKSEFVKYSQELVHSVVYKYWV